MNIRQCYVTLELPLRSPLDEVKLAYKDLVQVWHPDRFAHNPRLQQKAADKMQQLNEAYDTLKLHLERDATADVYAGFSGRSNSASSSGASSTSSGRERGTTTETHAADSTRQKASRQAGNQASSFMDNNPYSLRWRLQAAGVIMAFIGLLFGLVGLTMLIAYNPLMLGMVALLPVGAYGYRLWATR